MSLTIRERTKLHLYLQFFSQELADTGNAA